MIFGLQGTLEHLTGLSGTALLVLLIAFSLALAFAGRRLVKALAFITGGLVVGSIGVSLASSYLAGMGNLGALIGGVLGFLVGGFIGLALVYFGIGIGIGYFGYIIAASFVSNSLIPIAAGIVLFLLGIFLANKILSVATSVLGGILMFEVVSSLGAGDVLSLILALGVALFGIWVQTRQKGQYSQKAPPIQAPNTV